MLAPLSWLKDYVDIDVTPKELEEKLFSCGFEVEELIEVGKDITEVYYQMDDESLGDPCFIPTNHEKEEYLDLVQKLEEFDYSLATYFRQLID